MKSLSELQKDLEDNRHRLESISIKNSQSSKWRPNVLDQFESSSYTITEYTDPVLARQLQERISYISDQIENYDYYRMREEQLLEAQRQKEREDYVQRVESTAKELYEKALSEYHNKSLVGKAITFFKGKKPKRISSEQELKEAYGKTAEKEIMIDEIQRKMQELEAERKRVIDYYEKESGPNRERWITYYNDYYDSQIASLREQVNSIEIKRSL